jgi:hypothetical protein
VPASISQIRSLLAAVALVSLSGLLQAALAAPSGSCGSVDRLTVALRFAQVLFPELEHKEFSLTFSHGNGTFISSPTDMDAFRVRFDKPIWPSDGKQQLDSEQPPAMLGDGTELPFYLYFNFIDVHGSAKERQLACHPSNFTSTAASTQMEKVWSAINPHPEWSDEEELGAARKLGLYGPEDKSAILKKLPLKELAKFYGPLRIKSAEFRMNGGGKKCPGCSFADPRWYITLSGSGTTRGLLIIVEPFFGRITSISE